MTFLSNSSFLQKNPIKKNRRGFDIGLSFQVPPTTQNGLLLLESAAGDVCHFVQQVQLPYFLDLMPEALFKCLVLKKKRGGYTVVVIRSTRENCEQISIVL